MRKYVLLIALIASSCTAEKKSDQEYFYSLNKFYQFEVSRLDSLNVNLTKIACLNGKCDTLINPEINWEEELSLIAEADINKSAWRDSYSTTKIDNKTTYTCTDDDLTIREISFVLKNDGLSYINFTKLIENKIYRSSQELIYIPDIKLSVKGKMSVLESTSTDYEVIYLFN